MAKRESLASDDHAGVDPIDEVVTFRMKRVDALLLYLKLATVEAFLNSYETAGKRREAFVFRQQRYVLTQAIAIYTGAAEDAVLKAAAKKNAIEPLAAGRSDAAEDAEEGK